MGGVPKNVPEDKCHGLPVTTHVESPGVTYSRRWPQDADPPRTSG